MRQPGGRRARRYGGAPRQASQQPPEIRLCSAGPSFTRPSASGRRDLAPILLGALARPYVRSSPTRSGIHWRMGAVMCHLGLPMRAKRRRGPEQQKSQSRVHTGTLSVIALVATLRAIRRGNKRRSGSLEAQPLGWQVQL